MYMCVHSVYYTFVCVRCVCLRVCMHVCMGLCVSVLVVQYMCVVCAHKCVCMLGVNVGHHQASSSIKSR